MKTVARITFISRYTDTKFVRVCKLTTARKKYECSVKGCTHKIKPGEVHWTDQTYRICVTANHPSGWERED